MRDGKRSEQVLLTQKRATQTRALIRSHLRTRYAVDAAGKWRQDMEAGLLLSPLVYYFPVFPNMGRIIVR